MEWSKNYGRSRMAAILISKNLITLISIDRAYPFRTGITAIRMAIADILEKINSESASHTFKQ